MPTPTNPKLYKKAKEEADLKYSKPSAYKSGYIVKRYKDMGGKYKDDDHEKTLKRWFLENWININDGKGYPVLRPTIRINKNTPKTVSELNPKYINDQIKLKQKIKGSKNLPKFK
jgi:hypothetical protein